MTNLQVNNKINICCYGMFALYFIILLTIYGFGVYFLENLGLTYIEIGITMGISALASSILQPLIGRFVDTHHYSWQKILILLNSIVIISVIAMFFIHNKWCNLLFAIIIIASGCMYPFINYSPFYYENNGFKTNFGVARGFGSLSFTIFSSIIAFVVIGAKAMIVHLFSLVSSIIMIIIIFLLPDYGYGSKKAHSKKFKNNILVKYPIFTLIVIALIFIMTFQNLFECYMINVFENIGGNISNVGIANSISSVLELPVMFLFLRILKRVSAKNLIIIASVFYVIRSVMIFLTVNPYGIYLAQVLQIATYALILPASVHLTNELVDENDQYEAQSFLGATVTVGLIFATLLGGNILQLWNINVLLIVLVALTVLGSIFSFAILFIKR